MHDAQSLIAYCVQGPDFPWNTQFLPRHGDARFSTFARALTGMQKEAVVLNETDGSRWRLLCDEGPWLNGTDLAPFPLGYFAAGLTSWLADDIHAEASKQKMPIGRMTLCVDLFFTMEGSILSGTMAAGVESVRISADVGPLQSNRGFEALLKAALEGPSMAVHALRAQLPSRFCLRVNGEPVEWPGLPATVLNTFDDVKDAFNHLQPEAGANYYTPLVWKDESAAVVASGPAVGLQSEQKRMVHVRADAQLNFDVAKIGVRCIQPAGSRFVFLSDVGLRPKRPRRAPSGLIYLSAGIAFCFMTQLGRYAQIRKLPLRDYRIAQLTAFRLEGAEPVETAVFLDSDDTAANNLEMVRMGERTCYVHTSFREPVEVSWRTGG